MAQLVELYYWTGDNPNHSITDQWKRAETAESGNALNYIEYTHKLGTPAEAYITLMNPVPNPFSGTLDKKTGPLNILTASEDSGSASAVFSDLQRVYIEDPETHIIILYGRIYNIETNFDKMQGHTVNIRIKDELEMLRGVYSSDLAAFAITGGSTKRSDVIKTSLIANSAFNTPAALGLSNQIDTSDTNRYVESLRTYPSGYDGTLETVKSNANLLGIIAELAQEDPNSSTSTTIADNFGYDYYLDHNFQTVDNSGADTTTPATPHLNYFPRGTRPNTDVSTYGLTVEFPTSGTFAETGQKVAMLDDFDFERPKNEIFTDASVTGIKGQQGAFTKNFEVINVASISGTFTWSGKDFSKEIDRTLTDGSTAVEFLDEYTADGSTKNHDDIARIQYQSKTTGSGFLMISDLTTDFPTGSTQVMLKGATSGITCLFTPSTGRAREKLGIKRTFKTKWGLEKDTDNLRKKIAGMLSRSGSTFSEIVRGSFAFNRLPYFYKDAVPSTTSSTVFNMSINPQSYGFEKGMTVGMLDSASVLEDYSYASNTSSGSITTTGISDTDGNAGEFHSSAGGRFFVPVRAGDMIYASCPTESVTSNMLVTKLEFRQGPGLGHATRVEVVGKDSAVGGKMPKITIPNVDDGAGTEGTLVPRGTFPFSFPDDGSNNTVKFSATDHNTIAYTTGVLLLANGEKFDISGANLELTTAYDNTSAASKSQTSYIIYFDADVSETAFQLALQNAYGAASDHNTIEIGWARADADPGKAEFLINGTNPDGQNLGLSTEFHSVGNSVSITDDGIDIREGSDSDSFLTFYKGSTKVSQFFANDSTANSAGSSTQVNFQQYFGLSNSVMQIGSLGSFGLQPHVQNYQTSLGKSTKGWNRIYTNKLYATNPSSGSATIDLESEATTKYSLTVGTDVGYLKIPDGSNSSPAIQFSDDTNTGIYSSGDNVMRFTSNGTAFAQFGGDYSYIKHFLPWADDTYDLGYSVDSTHFRWDDIYATNDTINTSDGREKEDIKPVELGLEFLEQIEPVTYRWKKKKENKPDQIHYGIIAQQVMKVLKQYNIESTDDFGGLTGSEEGMYGARYGEFVAILIKAIQELSQQIKELKEGK